MNEPRPLSQGRTGPDRADRPDKVDKVDSTHLHPKGLETSADRAGMDLSIPALIPSPARQRQGPCCITGQTPRKARNAVTARLR